MNKDFCPSSCGFYDEGEVKGGCTSCTHSENVTYATALRALAFGEEVLVDGEGKEGYHLQDGGWLNRSAVEFL